ncbi:MAG: PD-(D/E)XK nuclease family transposase [Treponema sp.]|jgi:predicted transposase/invertase (TIGR01784 family)|nr:PD-(D/E)XK nuclease family transposase [Treponema sp.]
MALLQFDETDDLIDICMDNVFKAVFTRETPESRKALSRLLSAIIARELTVVVITANEPPIDNLRDRQIRFDITCKGEDGELVNIEMSLNPDSYEPVRLEFHAGKLFTGQDIRGTEKTYNDLKAAYQIAVLAKGRFFGDEEFLHSFEYYDPLRGVSLGGRSRIITLELSKLDSVVEKPAGAMTMAEQWGIFFRYLTDKSKREKINDLLKEEEGIAMAGKELLMISKDEIERARLMSEYKYEVDTQSKVVHARREGIQEGMEKGIQKGIQIGQQKGRQEGKLEGRQEGRQEVSSAILEFINAGYSLEDIKKRLQADRNL